MAYRLFDNGQYDADTVTLMSVVLDEVRAELGLAKRDDRLTDLVAREIMACIDRGERDQDKIRACAIASFQTDK